MSLLQFNYEVFSLFYVIHQVECFKFHHLDSNKLHTLNWAIYVLSPAIYTPTIVFCIVLGCKLVPERKLLKRAIVCYTCKCSESIYSGAMKRIMYFIVLIAQTQLAISSDQRQKP